MRPITYTILRRLADGRFHSGSTLADQLQVSRTAVWEALAEAEEFVPIFRVRGRGYQLAEAAVWLDPQAIAGNWQLDLIDELDSTNGRLAALGEAAHGRCLMTELQTAGRGRRGRKWLAQLTGSLTFSIGWKFVCPPGELGGLSLAIGLALQRALRAFGVVDVQLKWPNDLLRHGRKLAGILIEVQGDALGPSLVIIGVGMNVRLPVDLQQLIDQPASDLSDLPQPVDRNQLMTALLAELSTVLADFSEHGFGRFRAEFNAAHAFHGHPVTVLLPDGNQLTAMVEGVSERGALLVTTANGIRELTAGEVSLRAAP